MACDTRAPNTEIASLNTNREILEAATHWRLDASQEEGDLFYEFDGFEEIRSGLRSIVIGRKGSGKTSIAETLVRAAREDSKILACVLSFKDFPFNFLYEFKDTNFPKPSHYITLWKFLVYSNVCFLLSRSSLVDLKTREVLREQFPSNPSIALDRVVRDWMSTGFKVSAFTIGGEYSRSDSSVRRNLSLRDRVIVLEEFLLTKLGDTEVFVIFDELHEDYTGLENRSPDSNYFLLLRGLIRASTQIANSFNKSRIKPIVLLRDDIFDLIVDPDKNKWSDGVFDLTWSRAQLTNLVTYRMTGDAPVFNFLRNNSGGPIQTSSMKSRLSGQQQGLFDYMLDHTHSRPRDILKFIQLCSLRAVAEGREKIDNSDIVAQADEYSRYFFQEIFDECHMILPDFERIMEVFAHKRSLTMSSETFETKYNEVIGTDGALNAKQVLEVLFYFSAIGVRLNKLHFRYLNRRARIVFPNTIMLHPGLSKRVLL